MSKQQIDQQVDLIRRELTRISYEIQYTEGTVQQSLRIRQARLEAELDRLEAFKRVRAVYTIRLP